jgi:VWFA-related protein
MIHAARRPQITLARMTRCLVPCVLAAAAWTVAASAQAPAGPARSSVVIDAVALDKSGGLVADLTPRDLEVWIGHFRVPVENLEAVTPETDRLGGRLIVLLMDDLTLPLPQMGLARDVARRFIGRLLPGDQMAVVMLGNPLIESTNDPAKLRRAIDRYAVRATSVIRGDQLGAQLLNTVAGIARSLTEAGDGRKVIVGIGTGWLLDRPIPPPTAGADLRAEWTEAMRATSRSRATFYAIDPGGVGSARMDGGDSGFARETGGHAFLNTNDLNGAVDRILRETGRYYLIGVGNPPVGGKGLRELEVRSLRRGVTIRARRAIH